MRQTRPYCLASSSPRRRELLSQFGLDFCQHAPQADERQRAEEPAETYVQRLAWEKAEAVQAAFPEHLILAGDTVVMIEKQVLGKPRNAQDAKRMLELLSGKRHEVCSSYALLDGPSGRRQGGCAATAVTLRRMPPQWLHWYAHSPEPLDKAGAYAIQGIGGAMVERIEGSYSTIVGFPMETIIQELFKQEWLVL